MEPVGIEQRRLALGFCRMRRFYDQIEGLQPRKIVRDGGLARVPPVPFTVPFGRRRVRLPREQQARAVGWRRVQVRRFRFDRLRRNELVFDCHIRR